MTSNKAPAQLGFDFDAPTLGVSSGVSSGVRSGVPASGVASSDAAPAALGTVAATPSVFRSSPPTPTTRELRDADRPARGRAALRARTAVLHSRLLDMGLRNVDALVLMRTRTVMVSLIGRTLRVNEGYAEAPESVLRAIVQFATARTRVARNTAKDVILSYEVARPPASRRPERARPGDEGIVLRLRAAHHELNVQHFDGALTAIALRLSGKMATRLGHFDPGSRHVPPEIVLSRRHVTRHGWREAMHTLLHEMVHQWQHETGIPVDHGREFRRKAREVGITPAARRDLTPLESRRARTA